MAPVIHCPNATPQLIQIPPPIPKGGISHNRGKWNIIAMLHSSGYVLGDWTPTPVQRHHDVALHIDRKVIILRKIVKATRLPIPTFLSSSVMRRIMMHRLWTQYDVQDANNARCGSTIQGCCQMKRQKQNRISKRALPIVWQKRCSKTNRPLLPNT